MCKVVHYVIIVMFRGSCALGWRLMSLVSAYYHPSQYLQQYLSAFLRQHTDNPDDAYCCECACAVTSQ